jgi:hypothetical protein
MLSVNFSDINSEVSGFNKRQLSTGLNLDKLNKLEQFHNSGSLPSLQNYRLAMSKENIPEDEPELEQDESSPILRKSKISKNLKS